MKIRTLSTAGALILGAAAPQRPLFSQQEPPKAAAKAMPAARLVPMPAAPAVEPTQAELQRKRAAKLALPVFQSKSWLTDFAAAKAQAARDGKLVLTLFTRSYAYCGPCEALENGLLSTPEFAEFAKQIVLFLHVTTHVDGDRDPDLLREKGGRGFPTLAFLDASGALAAMHVGEPTVAALGATLREAESFAKGVIRPASAGDKDAQRKLFVTDVERGSITLEAAQALRQAIDLDAASAARVDQGMANVEFRTVLTGVRGQKDLPKAKTLLLAMLDAGRLPTGGDSAQFWGFLMTAAELDQDPKLGKRVLLGIEKQGAAAPVMASLRTRFEKLEASAAAGAAKQVPTLKDVDKE